MDHLSRKAEREVTEEVTEGPTEAGFHIGHIQPWLFFILISLNLLKIHRMRKVSILTTGRGKAE